MWGGEGHPQYGRAGSETGRGGSTKEKWKISFPPNPPTSGKAILSRNGYGIYLLIICMFINKTNSLGWGPLQNPTRKKYTAGVS